MTPIQDTTDARPGGVPLWERVAWTHPEWWSVALSVTAWLVLVVRTPSIAVNLDVPLRHHDHAATLGGTPSGWMPATFNWLLMVVAMMLPLVLGSIRTTAARSLWRRRHRAIGAFLIGYLSPWLLVGLSTFFVTAALAPNDWLHLPVSAAIGFAIAAAWEVTAVKWRALRSCHRTSPLAPDGWHADRDCARYGWRIGTRCVMSCWALMLACSLAGHGVVTMASAGIIGLVERYTARPDRRVISGVLCGVALIYATVALR